MIKPRTNTSDNIYDTIKEELLSGELSFGDRIVEIDYSKKLNVSRTPLREAIKKLEIEGIVERLANGRVKIIDITPERIKEIFKIRIALENILLESIAQNPEVISLLEENLILTEHYIKLKRWNETKKLFLEFNQIFYQKSDLEFTIKILKQYDFILSKLRLSSLSNKERIISACEEHTLIVKYLKSSQLELAKAVNTTHLLSAETSLLSSIDFD
ncbi:GntR family transcriptional regulator [uncultured Ilyobacter sp.]|uniref:GntR family transcriptional regulator n=1 Tax=uncultured Ilyobacter sp. TaxID=544433 RepID=UPI0029C69E7D|nr:GntR family transcriptional regulator [uncultured Ilyobacter sp.]